MTITRADIRTGNIDLVQILLIRFPAIQKRLGLFLVSITYPHVPAQVRNLPLPGEDHPLTIKYVAVIIPRPAAMWEMIGIAGPW